MPQNRSEILESLLVSNHRLTRAAAQQTGSTVSAAVWSTLSVLSNDGPRRIGDLASEARISQPGMTKIVRNLVADGWAVRTADGQDSRVSLIEVTEAGRAAAAEWRAQLSASMGGIFADLTAEEWDALGRAAGILARHTQQTIQKNQKKEVAA